MLLLLATTAILLNIELNTPGTINIVSILLPLAILALALFLIAIAIMYARKRTKYGPTGRVKQNEEEWTKLDPESMQKISEGDSTPTK